MAGTISIEGHDYVVKPDHRNGAAKKSQWTIPVPAEHDAFRVAMVNGWQAEDRAWGLHYSNGTVAKLGVRAKDSGDPADLYIAYFLIDKACHGYPSDPVKRSHEIPPEAVAQEWLDKSIMRPQAVRKLGRGLPCKP